MDEDTEGERMEEEGCKEEEDPLDAYMAGIEQELKTEEMQKEVEAPAQRTADRFNWGDDERDEADDFGPAETDIEGVGREASTLLSKGRQLPAVDHALVDYPPFRKNFYTEVPEIARMTKKEVEEYRKQLDEIKVRGRGCPKPIKTWAQCGISAKILECLKRNGYTKPTPVQTQTIPAIMSGRDVIGVAKTGSGKTLAFLLPMFRHICDQPPLEDKDGPIALILSPTRELALQTWKEAQRFGKLLGIKAVCVYGGVGISEQIADLKRGAEVVVCTPGRMIDMLAANHGKVTNLRRVTYLTLDEADRMFDMGFEPQVMKIVNNIRPDRQTILFSATFPRQMEELARRALVKPIEIIVGGRSVVCSDIAQNVIICAEHEKLTKMLELLRDYWERGNVLVFVDKQEKADHLVGELMKLAYNCAPLHGGIDQFDRDSAIVDFKTGKLKLLTELQVATSVAARGLDVKKLVLVINYDVPNHYEDYVHRCGRTGRAGNKGWAYTFILPQGQERMAGEVCRAFELSGQEPPADAKKMWEDFRDEMAAQGKEIRLGGGAGGFMYGSGYHYDEAEEEHEGNKKKLARLIKQMEGNQDEDLDVDEQLASMLRSKRRRVRKADPTKSTEPPDSKMAKAKAAAEKIAKAKKLAPVGSGGGADPLLVTGKKPTVEKGIESSAPFKEEATSSALSKAKQAAALLNRRLAASTQQTPLAEAEEERDEEKLIEDEPDFERPASIDQPRQMPDEYFEEELEINDLPQQLRCKVSSKESLRQVYEFADVGIAVRGEYYPPGKEPKKKEGGKEDRKLYIYLQARDEITLRRAKEEVVRILRETLRQMVASGKKPSIGGRYKVL